TRGDDDLTLTVAAVRCRELCTDADERRECCANEELLPVPIDIVLESGVTGRVDPRQPIECDRRSVREHEARPNHQHTPLAEGDLTIVLAEKTRALRDQQVTSSGAVVNGFGNGCQHLAR